MIIRNIGPATKLLLVDDLPPEDLCMLQALYSRSAASAATHLEGIYAARRSALRSFLHAETGGETFSENSCEHLREIAIGDGSERAGNFMRKFYVGYGHSSIADTGSTTLFLEGVSLLAAKAIQDSPLYCGQETSTRYIDMSRQTIVDPVGSSASADILRAWMEFYVGSQERVAATTRERYPMVEHEDPVAYLGAVKARTFDVLRAFLPAGIRTQLSWHTNLRQASDRLRWLKNHPSWEVSDLGAAIGEVLGVRYPDSFGATSAVSGVGAGSAEAQRDRAEWERLVATVHTYQRAFNEGDAYASFTPSHVDRGTIASYSHLLNTRPRGCVLPHFLADVGQFTWQFPLDFGSFRDIQRQRNGVCRMPLLDTSMGFEGWYLDQLDPELRASAEALVETQAKRIAEVTDNLVDRQYYTALGFRVPCSVTYALPASVYVIELRSGKMVHPTLRKVAHSMADDLVRFLPEVPMHVDRTMDSWSVRRGLQTITKKM